MLILVSVGKKQNNKIMTTIEKLSDDMFNGQHPNEIYEGYTKTLRHATEIKVPVVGECYLFGSLRTSEVISIESVDDTTCIFKTENSTYKITLIK